MRIPQSILRPLALIPALLVVANALAAQSTKKEQAISRDLVWEKLESRYRYENDGTGKIATAARVRVVTELGLKQAAQAYFPYSSQLEDLRIDYFRTLKKDGSRLDVDPSKAFEVASPISQVAPLFSDIKIKAVPAPNLQVGDAIEYAVTKVIRTPLKPGDFWAMHVATVKAETDSEVVVLDVPADRSLLFQADPKFPYKTEEKSGRKIYRWEFSNREPRQSYEVTQKPLFSASTLADWKQLGEWFLALQSGRTAVTPEILALSQKLTASKSTARQKLEAIYTYVSESVRYVAIELGIGGYQEHPAADVLRNAYGDCKDKQGLLTALLEAAGMKSYPALVNSERGVVEEIVPVPAQFDHVISAVPLGKELIWLDTTLEVAPMGLLSQSLRGKKAVLIESGATRLVEIPQDSPVPSQIRLVSTGKLDSAGKLELEDSLTLRGPSEVPYRQVFRSGNKEAISSIAKVLASAQVEGAEPSDPSSSDPNDLSGAFSVKFSATAANFIKPLDQRKEAQVPHVVITENQWSSLAGEAKDAAQKHKEHPDDNQPPRDIDLGVTGEMEESMDLAVDPSFDIELPLPIHIDRPFLTYESNYVLESGHLKTHRLVRTKLSKIPAAQWQQLESFDKLVTRDLSQIISLRRTKPLDLENGTEALTAEQLNDAGLEALNRMRYSQARDFLEKATAKDPKHASAWNNLGRAYAGLEMRDEAEKAYQKQLEINPSDEFAYNNLGLLYHQKGQYDEAVEAFKKQIEINPLDKFVYPNLATTYVAMKKWGEAADAFEKARNVLHDNPPLLVQIGNMYLKAGKTDEALRRFDRALELDVMKSPGTYNEVAYALAEAHVELDKAREYAQSAVERMATGLQPVTLSHVPPMYANALDTLGAFLDTLGWVYFQQGKLAEAKDCIHPAFEIRESAVLAEHLARVYAGLNRPEDALRYYAYAWKHSGAKAEISHELQGYIKDKFGEDAVIDKRLEALAESFRDSHRVELPGRALTWPAGAPDDAGFVATVRVWVDENGAVADAEAKSGREPYRAAALADARQIKLSAFAWPGEGLKTVRTINFYYLRNRRVKADWIFGAEGNVMKMPGPLVEREKEEEIGSSHPPSAANQQTPESDRTRIRAHDANNEFTRGAQIEVEAVRATDPKVSQEKFEAAFEAYKKAYELEPRNPSYRSAYLRLQKKLKKK